MLSTVTAMNWRTMTPDEWVIAAGAVAFGATCIAIVLRFTGRIVWRMVRGAVQFVIDTRDVVRELTRGRNGDGGGEPNVFVAFRQLIEDVSTIKTQVTPNGGTSDTVADRIQRMELALADHIGRPISQAHEGGGSP